jgi:hypothetical protein
VHVNSFFPVPVLLEYQFCCQIKKDQLTRQTEREEVSSSLVNEIDAFEDTLNLRVIQPSQLQGESSEIDNDDEDTVASDDADHLNAAYRQRIRHDLLFYGDHLECLVVDSDPSFIARAMDYV